MSDREIGIPDLMIAYGTSVDQVTVSWQRCPRCGKERHVEDEREAIGIRSTGQTPLRLCKACESEMFQERDECPEYLRVAGGWSFCRLGWKHEGRCTPYTEADR